MNPSIEKKYICDVIPFIIIQCISMYYMFKQDSHFFKMLGYCKYFSNILTIILKSCDSLLCFCDVKKSNEIKVMHNTVEPGGSEFFCSERNCSLSSGCLKFVYSEKATKFCEIFT